MEQGLLLDGIDVRGRDARIHQRVVGAATVFAHAAIAAFAVVDHALAGAKLALDLLRRRLAFPFCPTLFHRCRDTLTCCRAHMATFFDALRLSLAPLRWTTTPCRLRI